MGKEIEKKYLLRENGINHTTEAFYKLYDSVEDLEKQVRENGKFIRQGYLSIEAGINLAKILGMQFSFEPSEIRLREKAGSYYLTLKGAGDLVRDELEKPIPWLVFDNSWDSTYGSRVEKYRLKIPYNNFSIEFDVYTDRNLMMAEIETPSIEIAESLKPLGKDVTNDPRYKNKNLAR